jgi:hypothetical protein
MNVTYGVIIVIEDASALIIITLLFNFSRFIPNSKTAYLRLMKNGRKNEGREKSGERRGGKYEEIKES